MYSALDIANAFIRLGIKKGNNLTHLQVQKLVYIAFGFYIAVEDKPLHDDRIIAWPYGPVNFALYRSLKKYGREPISETVCEDCELDDNVQSLVEAVYNLYGDYSGSKLSNLTHKIGTPWQKTKRLQDIDHELIKKHYQELLRI